MAEAIDPQKIWTQVEDKAKEMQPVRDRQKKDLNQFNLTPYAMSDYEGKAIKRIDNVTLNEPAIYAKHVMAALNGSQMAINVRGKDLDDEKRGNIKGFLHGAFHSIDKDLRKMGLSRLKTFLIFQMVIRGYLGVRIWEWKKNDVVRFGALPFDTYHATWEKGEDGMIWAAYPMRRSKAAIQQQYEMTIADTYGTVLDFFDREKYVTLIDKKLPKNGVRPNPYGVVPVIINTPGPIEFIPENDEDIKHHGESIFFTVRDVYDNQNKLATVEMTQAVMGFRGALQWRKPLGSDAEFIGQDPYGAAKVLELGEGWLERIPLADTTGKLETMYGIFSSSRQRGSVTDIQYGELHMELPAVALAKLSEAEDQIYVPLLDCLVDTYNEIGELLIRQFVKNEFETILTDAEEMEESPYKASDIDHKARVTFEFLRVSPSQNVANISIANASKPFYSSEYIRREVLRVRDEGEMERQLEIERLRELSPTVDKYMATRKLLTGKPTEEEQVAAFIAAQEMGMSVEQVKGGAMPEQLPPPEPGAKGIPGALPQTSAGEASQLQTQMRQQGLVPQPKEKVVREK